MPKPSKVALVESSTSTASEKPVRRSFTAADKIRIVREAELCLEPGALGELLRREGIYSSHLSKWRALLREHGEHGLAARKPGPVATKDARDEQLARMTRENARLQRELEVANRIIDLQKKVSELLAHTRATKEES